MKTAAFIPLWSEGKDSFKSNPPNADISLLEGKTLTQIVVELQDPVLNGDDLAYTIKVLPYTIRADVEIPDGGAEGMIVTQGGRFGGYGLFLSKGEFGFGRGRVVFLYNLLDLKRTTWEGPELDFGQF
jgi:hypothetical protein